MYNKILSFFLTPILFASIAFAQSNDTIRPKSKLPKCNGMQSDSWSNCAGKKAFEGDRTYEGEFHNGTPDGEGVFSEGGLIVHYGKFKNGYPHGEGIEIIKYGDSETRNEGSWVFGLQEGQGIQTNSNGTRYEGTFEKGVKSGQGVETMKDGEKYVGEFKFGNRHGNGVLIYPHGGRFVGGFKFGKKHGVGTHFDAKGIMWGKGQYRGGSLNGFAFYVDDGKRYFEGFYQDYKLVRKESVDETLLEENFIDIDPLDFVVENPNNLSSCPIKSDGYADRRNRCWRKSENLGNLFLDENENLEKNGLGFIFLPIDGGVAMIGEYKNGKRSGKGMDILADGTIVKEGIYQLDELVKLEKVDLPIFRKKEYLEILEKTKQLTKKSIDKKFNLKVTHTKPAADGIFFINVSVDADTASLLIDGEEQGGRKDGNYSIKRVARAGQLSSFKIVATDIYGTNGSETITVSREIVGSKAEYASLNPSQVRGRPNRDAVAIIIGIADYRSLPKAEFANDDARVFYDYAIRALGVKPENIKLLVDADAEEVEIIKTFKNWLPSRVKSTTDVYVFYSGHGLPTQDGQDLYLLPPRADRDFISRTAIRFQELNADLQAAKPKSVTIFMDACYSGQARSGETLVTNARPVVLKAEKKLFPDNFTVIAASQADQISSSSPDLKHGIFSYYLMKGMEGDADTNKDNKITLGEMRDYLVENVGRHAAMVSRQQTPQLIGDENAVLTK
jgi:hypothetical protein